MNHAIMPTALARTTQRYAIYARYSSHLQDPRSIPDQIALCEERIRARGGTVAGIYTDSTSTGQTLHERPGLAQMLQDAKAGLFDAIYTEALDRISRIQTDTSGIYDRLVFHDLDLVTIEEGEVQPIHIAFKGVMNQGQLVALASKTRRGQMGRVREGRAGGGLSYGYNVANRVGPDGKLTRGLRTVNREQAKVVRRIFRLYADGASPRNIAALLNADGIPGPRKGLWTAYTINGRPRRGTGILNNELYRGRIVFNRTRKKRNPDTGKHVARDNPPAEWIVTDVPNLRIVDDALWDAVQTRRLKGYDRRQAHATRVPLPLSPLLHCAVCGGSMSVINKGRYGCTNRRQSGTCEMNRRIAVDVVERHAMESLHRQLSRQQDWPALLAEAAAARQAAREAMAEHMAANQRHIANIVSAIQEGTAAQSLHRQLLTLENTEARLKYEYAALASPPTVDPDVLTARLLDKLDTLAAAIANARAPVKRHDALMTLSTLIERIVAAPDPDNRYDMNLTVTPRTDGLVDLAIAAA